MIAVTLPAAGVLLVLGGAVVLAGWGLDVPQLTSVAPAWRVMVPSTAFSLLCLGASLCVADRRSGRVASAVALLLAVLALVLPAATVAEYGANTRFSVEHWLGFDVASQPDAAAGRMSPMAALALVSLGVAGAASALPGQVAGRLAMVSASTTLIMSWLSLLVVAFDTTRLLDTPVFPGLAAPTILLLTVGSGAILDWAGRSPTRARDGGRRSVVTRWVIAGMFTLPLLAAWLRSVVERTGVLDPSLVVALTVFIFSLGGSAMFWNAVARMRGLEAARERSLDELERRVDERTEALAAANQQLSTANRRKDEFLATLAHELRNPLAPIRNAVRVLELPGVTAEHEQAARGIIARQVDHMVRLIDDLLDVSRITTGRFRIREERVLLGQILARAVEMTQPHVERSRHRLIVELPDTPIWLQGDAARLTQVFSNLLHNACKYMDGGGTIGIKAAVTGGLVSVSVCDRGIGIPAAFLPHVFDKFAQEAPALDRSDGGLGLGLSLVRGIVRLHGGDVSAESAGRPGEGSTFTVQLPVAAAAAPAPAPPDPPPAAAAARRILVVDDNRDGADSLAALLAHKGYAAAVAYDGETALAACEADPPDVLLLDIGLPGMSGYDLCRTVRDTAWGAHMLIVAQTGWGQRPDLELANRAGFDFHFVKPVDTAMLESVLARAVPPSARGTAH